MKTKIFFLQLAFIFLFATHICTAQTGIWTELKPQNSPSPRAAFGMAEIGDNNTIIFGGIDINYKSLDETWIYNFDEINWIQVNTDIHPVKRYDLRMARITKNKVLLFGGWDTDYYNDTWIFDLDSLSWKEIKSINKPSARRNFGLAQLYDGKVLLFGGDTIGGSYSNDTWIYENDSNNWSEFPISNLINTRPPKCEGAMLAQLDTGMVLYYGGFNENEFDETWLLDYNLKKWIKLEPKFKSVSIASSAMANIRKNQVVFWGGDCEWQGGGAHYDELWLFNLKDTTWKKIQTNIKPDGRYLHGISKLGQDSILLFGGLNNNTGLEHNDTWLLTMDRIDDVRENTFAKSENIKSYLIPDKNRNFILNGTENFSYGNLYDIYGKIIYSFSLDYTNRKCTIELNLQTLSNGIYFIVLYKNQGIKVIKILEED
ncbi:MAG: kelch repeat-containing protein [FCB group bacterium]